MTTAATISCARMRALIDSGRARPLLPDRFPSPVELHGRWWHLPDDGGDELFVPAPAGLAAHLGELGGRRRAADRAVRRHDGAASG